MSCADRVLYYEHKYNAIYIIIFVNYLFVETCNSDYIRSAFRDSI